MNIWGLLDRKCVQHYNHALKIVDVVRNVNPATFLVQHALCMQVSLAPHPLSIPSQVHNIM